MEAATGRDTPDLDGFRIDYVHKQNSFSMRSGVHNHKSYEIYYQISGERIYFIEDHVYHIRAGDLVLVDIGDLHKLENVGTMRFDWILISFTPEFLKSWTENITDTDLFTCFRQKFRQLQLNLAEQTNAESLFFRMLDEVRKRPAGYRTGVQLCLAGLLLFTVRCAERLCDAKNVPVSPIHEKITQAAQFIGNNYSQKISLRSIASMNHISYFYFCRAFRQITGYTLTEYINNVRVKRAKQLLRETRMSVADIACAVGFESATTFGRVFKSLTRMSPLRYRSQPG